MIKRRALSENLVSSRLHDFIFQIFVHSENSRLRRKHRFCHFNETHLAHFINMGTVKDEFKIRVVTDSYKLFSCSQIRNAFYNAHNLEFLLSYSTNKSTVCHDQQSYVIIDVHRPPYDEP
jgi:hypothetical protein